MTKRMWTPEARWRYVMPERVIAMISTGCPVRAPTVV